MTTRFYLDTRRSGDRPAPLKVSITSKGSTTYIPTNISVLPSQWDKRAQKVVAHPQKSQLNALLSRRKLDIDTALYELQNAGALHGLTAERIRQRVLERIDPKADVGLFLPRLDAYAARQTKAKTRELYEGTAAKVRSYAGRCADTLHNSEITVRWLEGFDTWMRENGVPSRNARNVYLRNIRTVFNEAIDDGAADSYPFRKFKICPEPTKSRALTLEQLRALFRADLGRHQIYADMFKLSFCLGGLSFCDLVALTEDNVVGGRVEFRRQKTGQLVSVGIQPEARALLDKWKGTGHLVCVADEYADVHGFMRRMSGHLRHVGQTYDRKSGEWSGDSVAPAVSQYWARYTLATLAAELGVGADVIGALLGHSTNSGASSVTQTYIRANRNRQVDELMRSVLDEVFHKA